MSLFLFFVLCSSFALKVEQESSDFQSQIEQPFQIVAPNEDHSLLVVNENSLRLLNQIKGPIAVVGVVGAFHSGKSFLLNQLLKRQLGFKIGPTVDPMTRGIWIWGKPLQVTKGGVNVNVLFLDTEGFYASNVSEAYDAKIFSVTALLSSYLIYNSVKIIDQAAIDYLELLARRTQLFALKAQVSQSSNSASENLNKLIQFPPLMWVVEDFFQDTQGETPSQWLNRLLEAFHRDGSQKTAILSIFPSADCHTLFIPHADKEKLRHLDQVDPKDLLPDYIADMEALRKRVFESLPLKGIDGQNSYMDGAGLSTLVRFLVSTANSETFPEMPSLWGSFLALQASKAEEDCIAIYKQEVQRKIQQNLIPPAKLEALHLELTTNLSALYKQFLFEDVNAYLPGLQKLKKGLEDLKSVYIAANNLKISQHIKIVERQLYDQFVKFSSKIELPVATAKLQQELQQFKERSITTFANQLIDFSSSMEYKENLQQLKRDFDGQGAQIQLENNKQIQIKLDNAVGAVKQIYSRLMTTDKLLNHHDFLQQHEKAEETALSSFNEEVGFAVNEPAFLHYAKNAKNELKDLRNIFEQANLEKADNLCKTVAHDTTQQVVQGFSSVVLPIDDEETQELIRQAKTKAIAIFQEKVGYLKDMPVYQTATDSFLKQLDKHAKLFEAFNIQELAYSCEDALKEGKRLIEENYKDFASIYLFKQYVRTTLDNLLLPKIGSEKTRSKIIEKFIQSDLKEIVQSVQNRQLNWIASILLAGICTLLATCWLKCSTRGTTIHRNRT